MKFVTLHDRLRGPIVLTLREKLGVQNVHALPHLLKITVNVGINRSKMEGKEMLEYIEESLKRITGQKPALRTAKKAISNFNIREGLVVGAMVTLRGKRMEAFLDKLLHIALPRVRDFRGVTQKLDGHGNYSIGLKEHTVFPEVPPPADASKLFGLQVTLTTTTTSDKDARALLEAIGVPFRKEKEVEGAREEKAAKQREAKKHSS